MVDLRKITQAIVEDMNLEIAVLIIVDKEKRMIMASSSPEDTDPDLQNWLTAKIALALWPKGMTEPANKLPI